MLMISMLSKYADGCRAGNCLEDAHRPNVVGQAIEPGSLDSGEEII